MANSAISSTLTEAGFSVFYARYSALARYFYRRLPRRTYLATNANLVDLARLFPHISYPELPRVSARLDHDGMQYLVQCVEDLRTIPREPYPVLDLLYDPHRNVFPDYKGVYPALRRRRLDRPQGNHPPGYVLLETARLVSLFGYPVPPLDRDVMEQGHNLSAAVQRDLLEFILESPRPERGLELLFQHGFVKQYWPELYDLAHVDHEKDFHPEGDGWDHTLQALTHRKRPKQILSLALLLHDVGKPVSDRTPEREFDNHSHLGARLAARFLRRLGYDNETVEQVTFLVRHHMLPAALGRLPVARVRPLMESPLFPTLLELHKADTAASFRSLHSYHEACRIYREFLKHRANPFRKIDGSRMKVRH